MKFLIIAALVAVAAAEYHDDVFHFSSLNSATGLQRASFVQTASPVVAKTFVAQPAYRQQYSAVKVAAPLLVQQEVPVFTSQYQPVYQQYAVKQYAQPAFQQYAVKYAQPAYTQQYVRQYAQPAYTQQYVRQYAEPAYTQQYTVKQVAQPAVFAQQYSGASTYASAYNGPQYRILSHVQEADPAGPYRVSYATENGIQHTEQGSLVPSAEGAAVAAQGSYSYTGPDGVQYTVNYIADENGFRASGDHLPTPPPIPAEIARSLELNAASGERYDEQGRLFKKK